MTDYKLTDELIEECSKAAWEAVRRLEAQMGTPIAEPWGETDAGEQQHMRDSVRRALETRDEVPAPSAGSIPGLAVHSIVREVALFAAEAHVARNEARAALQGREDASEVANRVLRERAVIREELIPELEALGRKLSGITDAKLVESTLVLRDVLMKLIRIQA